MMMMVMVMVMVVMMMMMMTLTMIMIMMMLMQELLFCESCDSVFCSLCTGGSHARTDLSER